MERSTSENLGKAPCPASSRLGLRSLEAGVLGTPTGPAAHPQWEPGPPGREMRSGWYPGPGGPTGREDEGLG